MPQRVRRNLGIKLPLENRKPVVAPVQGLAVTNQS
jgi:hypothetical protein